MTPAVTTKEFPDGPKKYTVAAGTTLNYYDPDKPGAPVKTQFFKTASSAHADAEVWVAWPGNPAPPVPRGGPFLRCIDGAGAGGLLIVEAQVTLEADQPPSPFTASQLAALRLRATNPFQQFGQSNCIYSTAVGGYPGGLGCTDTVLQFFILLWTGKMTTHDQIRKVAGYLGRKRGLYPAEVRKVLEYFKLPYLIYGQGDGKVTRPARTPQQLYDASKLGPIGIGHSYSYWPEWYGYSYKGVKSDGHPNGYSTPLGKAGRTQLTGITPRPGPASPSNPDGHFGALLGTRGEGTAFEVVAWEPNHGSGSRPERPAYDVFAGPQFANIYNSYKAILGRTQYSLVPTRALVP